MAETLAVLMGSTLAGTITRGANNLLKFAYDVGYRAAADATPISLSMPIAIREHVDSTSRRTVSNFLWGLLPDNELVLSRWARHYQVRSTTPFHLLGTPVGEDCAGAIAFVPQDGVDALVERRGSVEWLTQDDLETIVADLRADRTAWLGRDFAGQFSLAGAQAKTALLQEEGRWGRPTGARATTHIVKPASAGWADQDVNEHVCLDAAHRAGLVVPRSRIERFGTETAIVVERYDRLVRADGIARVHQEDMCQALGKHPEHKYENNGGPSVRTIANLLRRAMPPRDASDAIDRFADALAWNWIIGGTDAHAKNYSLLLAGRTVRLAPLYDLSSVLPYVGERGPNGEMISERRIGMAMKVGGEYDLFPPRNTWERAAADLGVSGDHLMTRVVRLVAAAPAAFAAAAAEPAVASLRSPVIERLVAAVDARARQCADVLP